MSDLKSKKTSKIPDLVERPKRIQGQPRLWAKKVPSMSRELDLEFHAQKPGAPTKVVHRSKMTPATKLFVSVMCVMAVLVSMAWGIGSMLMPTQMLAQLVPPEKMQQIAKMSTEEANQIFDAAQRKQQAMKVKVSQAVPETTVAAGTLVGKNYDPESTHKQLKSWEAYAKEKGMNEQDELLAQKFSSGNPEADQVLRMMLTLHRKSDGRSAIDAEYASWAQDKLLKDPNQSMESIRSALDHLQGSEFATERNSLIQVTSRFIENQDQLGNVKDIFAAEATRVSDDPENIGNAQFALLAARNFAALESDPEKRMGLFHSLKAQYPQLEIFELASPADQQQIITRELASPSPQQEGSPDGSAHELQTFDGGMAPPSDGNSP